MANPEKLADDLEWWVHNCDRCYSGCQAKQTLLDAVQALRFGQEANEPLQTTWETPESCPYCMEHLSLDLVILPGVWTAYRLGWPTDASRKIGRAGTRQRRLFRPFSPAPRQRLCYQEVARMVGLTRIDRVPFGAPTPEELAHDEAVKRHFLKYCDSKKCIRGAAHARKANWHEGFL